MTSDQLRTAMIEIGNGVKWEDSSIEPKNEENKADWDDLLNDFKEAEDEGLIVEIPDEFV